MDIRADIKAFLVKQAPAGASFLDSDNLLVKGVIDSLKMLDLINFIEQKFGVTVDEDEMMPDNFESVEAIVAFIAGKRESLNA